MNTDFKRVIFLLVFLLPCVFTFAEWRCVQERDEYGNTFKGGIIRSQEGYSLTLHTPQTGTTVTEEVDAAVAQALLGDYLLFSLDMGTSRRYFKSGKEYPAEIGLLINGEWQPLQTAVPSIFTLMGVTFLGTSSHTADMAFALTGSNAAAFQKATKMSVKIQCLFDDVYTMKFDITGIKKVYNFVGLEVKYPPSLEHLSSKEQTHDFDYGSFSCSETWQVVSEQENIHGTIGNEAGFAVYVSNDVIDYGYATLSEAEKRDFLRQSIGDTPLPALENSNYSYTTFKGETAVRITGTTNGMYADMFVTILQHRLVLYARFADSKAKLSHKAFSTISQTLYITPFVVDKNKVYSNLNNEAQFFGNGSSLSSYIAQNLRYPISVRTNGIHAKTTCSFVVERDGSISQVEVISSSNNKELDDEAVRVIRSMPRWQPATYVGESVRSRRQVEVPFNINPAITLSKDKLKFSCTGGTQTITVNSKENWNYHISPYARFQILRSGQQLKVSCQPKERNDYGISDEMLTISTADGVCKYKVQLTQESSPRPEIRLSNDNVQLEDKASSETIRVSSNRNWGYSQPTNKAFKVTMTTDSASLIINASRNLSRKDRRDNIDIFTVDPQFGKEVTRNVYIHQAGRQPSHFRENCSTFTDTYGKIALNLVKIDVALGTDMEDLYLPISLEVGAMRFSIVELSLLRFCFENTLTGGGLDGVLWEPQLRVLFPIKDSWSIVPVIGPSAYLEQKNSDPLYYDHTWGFSIYLGARKYWGKGLFHSDFYLGYQYGYYNSVVLGATLGCDLSW